MTPDESLTCRLSLWHAVVHMSKDVETLKAVLAEAEAAYVLYFVLSHPGLTARRCRLVCRFQRARVCHHVITTWSDRYHCSRPHDTL
jgi:hypothetical protein